MWVYITDMKRQVVFLEFTIAFKRYTFIIEREQYTECALKDAQDSTEVRLVENGYMRDGSFKGN